MLPIISIQLHRAVWYIEPSMGQDVFGENEAVTSDGCVSEVPRDNRWDITAHYGVRRREGDDQREKSANCQINKQHLLVLNVSGYLFTAFSLGSSKHFDVISSSSAIIKLTDMKLCAPLNGSQFLLVFNTVHARKKQLHRMTQNYINSHNSQHQESPTTSITMVGLLYAISTLKS